MLNISRISYAKVFLPLISVLFLSSCSSVATNESHFFELPGKRIERKQSSITDELHSAFCTRLVAQTQNIAVNCDDFILRTQHVYEQVVALEQTAHDAFANENHVDYNTNIPQELLIIRRARQVFSESLYFLYTEYGGRRVVLGRELTARDKHYFETEEDLLEYYFDRYPEIDLMFQTIDDAAKKMANIERVSLISQVRSDFGLTVSMGVPSFAAGNSLLTAAVFEDLSTDRLYTISGFEVVQTVKEGLLIAASHRQNQIMFFLDTDQRWPDGHHISVRNYGFIDGLFEYNSLLGLKTLYRVVHVVPDTQYYFID